MRGTNSSSTAAKRLATAGGAAAAAMYLAPGATPEAQAVIVHVTTPISITANGTGTQPDVPWDVDGNAVPDFLLHSSVFFGGNYLSLNGGGAFVNLVSPTEDGIEGFPTQATQFDVGPNLAAPYFFGENGALFRTMMYVGPGAGSFAADALGWAAATQYVGFRIGPAGPSARFGWASVTLDLTTDTLRINEWAFENSGGAIHLGVVPEPSTTGLALLACGAAGLRRWKSKKKAA
jgi:hypothetical protein